jgi:hypothetical protein
MNVRTLDWIPLSLTYLDLEYPIDTSSRPDPILQRLPSLATLIACAYLYHHNQRTLEWIPLSSTYLDLEKPIDRSSQPDPTLKTLKRSFATLFGCAYLYHHNQRKLDWIPEQISLPLENIVSREGTVPACRKFLVLLIIKFTIVYHSAMKLWQAEYVALRKFPAERLG